MAETPLLSLDNLLASLRAAGESTRVRLLALLAEGELTVKDITTILGQSQPRISRHLKLLSEARLIQRFPEGAWVYYRLSEGAAADMARDILAHLSAEDPVLAGDRSRRESIRKAQAEKAASYFAENARSWDAVRSLHVAEEAVEMAMLEILGERPVRNFLDLGTGTARVLELFADRYDRALGIDANPSMLSVARANLDKSGIRQAQVRQGDIYALPVAADSFDIVTVHQVLHYLDDPGRALQEAARTLRPGGQLLVVDFAPHSHEFLRDDFAHRRLGFPHEEISGWLKSAGLELVDVRDLEPEHNDSGELTVTLWLGRDPRMITDTPPVPVNLEVA